MNVALLLLVFYNSAMQITQNVYGSLVFCRRFTVFEGLQPTFCSRSFLGIDINFSNMVLTEETEESKAVSCSSIS